MWPVIAFVSGSLLVGVAWGWWHRRGRQRRARLLAAPLADELAAVVDRNLPIAKCLPEALRRRLHGRINVFLDEKRFRGCQGLEVTDEMRVTIAAQACLLIVNNRSQSWYNRLTTVLVYPSAYVAQVESVGEGGVVSESQSVRLGESWGSGTIVLAWSSSLQGGINFRDGRNVVIHEFAHQLDQIDGAGDGVPTLGAGGCYQTWARVLGEEYQELVNKTRRGRKTALDKYGATNVAEFFAVSSEAFFEKPRQLAKKHPELFAELQAYYGCDPREWLAQKQG